MPKYENGIIYKLCHQNDLENNNIYVGSTTNFRIRKNLHKNCCCNENSKKYNISVYQFIRDNGGWDEWQMIPIEKYPCNGKEELEIRERYHIELLKSKLNKVIPTRTIKEWYGDNKEDLAKQKKQYREDNKKIIAEKAKKYREDNKEKFQEYEKNRARYHNETEMIKYKQYHKKYNDVNKEKLAEKSKNRYEANKELILEKGKQKVMCDHCGCEVRKDGLSQHKKTNKCKNFNITKE